MQFPTVHMLYQWMLAVSEKIILKKIYEKWKRLEKSQFLSYMIIINLVPDGIY